MIVIIFPFSNVPTCASCVSLFLSLVLMKKKRKKNNKNEREKKSVRREDGMKEGADVIPRRKEERGVVK